MSKFLPYLTSVGFLLLIFATRIFAIEHFPVFIDETIHIYSAEKLSDISPLYNVNIGRILTIWWYWLFQVTQSQNPIWVTRVATLVIILPGITALLQLAYRISGYTALIMMGLFLLFSPYHYFFERLALADPVAASFVLVSIWIGYRLSKRVNYLDALLCGGVLMLAILAKTNVIPYAGIVLAAVVGFGYRHQLKSLAIWFLIATTSLLLPVIGFEILVRLTGNSWLIAIYGYVSSRPTTSVSLVERISGNILETITWFSTYMHPLMAIVLLIAFILTVLRRRFYLLLVFLAPLFPMWIGEPQETRYWLIPVGLIGLLLAIEVSETIKKFSWKVKFIPIAGMLLWGSFFWLPQMLTTTNNPVDLTLPETDRKQYILSDATGFGFEQVPEIIPVTNRPQIMGLG